MSALLCPHCAGRGEIAVVRWLPCCSGRNGWGEVVCGCGGSLWPEEAYEPCPAACPAPDPAPPPIFDPDLW